MILNQKIIPLCCKVYSLRRTEYAIRNRATKILYYFLLRIAKSSF